MRTGMGWRSGWGVCLLLSTGGCLDPLEDDMSMNGETVPADVQVRLQTHCANQAGCHGAGGTLPQLSSPQSNAILTSNATNGTPYVDLGDVGNSWIAQRILGVEGLPSMPPIASQDVDFATDMAVVIGWIAGYADLPSGQGDGSDDDDDDSTSGAGDDMMGTSDPPTSDTGTTQMSPDTGDDTTTMDGDTMEPDSGGTMVSYADIQGLWNRSCLNPGGGCHDGSQPPLLVDGSSYDEILLVPANADTQNRNYIQPGNLAESYLWQKMTGTPGIDFIIDPMPPPSQPQVRASDIQILKAWIEQGAQR